MNYAKCAICRMSKIVIRKQFTTIHNLIRFHYMLYVKPRVYDSISPLYLGQLGLLSHQVRLKTGVPGAPEGKNAPGIVCDYSFSS